MLADGYIRGGLPAGLVDPPLGSGEADRTAVPGHLDHGALGVEVRALQRPHVIQFQRIGAEALAGAEAEALGDVDFPGALEAGPQHEEAEAGVGEGHPPGPPWQPSQPPADLAGGRLAEPDPLGDLH